MRELTIGTKRYTKVVCLDEPGAGNACHEYEVVPIKPHPDLQERQDRFARIGFQNGGIQEVGVNGCMNEDLLAIVIDRLQGFQSGAFACEENAEALNCLNQALVALESRTAKRIARGVEGKQIV